MTKETDEFYLRGILESISYIRSFTKGVTQGRFVKDVLIQSATLKQLENIGEAVKNISEDLKEKNPAVSWGNIIGTRNILIHNYLKVDLDKIWSTVVDDLPVLKIELEKMLK